MVVCVWKLRYLDPMWLFVLSIFLLDFGHILSPCLPGYYWSPDAVYDNRQEILYDAICLQKEGAYAIGRQLGYRH